MKTLRMLASVVLYGLTSGCAAWTVHSETGPGAQLVRYRTFAWASPSSGDPLLDQRVRDQVVAQLSDKGLHPAPPGQAPDFLIAYRVQSGVLQQTVVDPNVAVAPGASGGTVIPPLPVAATYTYDREAVVLDFLDAQSGRVFWRGYASYVVDKPPEVSTAKTQQAVSKILTKYPASQLASASRPSG
jgi:hypothetical protein